MLDIGITSLLSLLALGGLESALDVSAAGMYVMEQRLDVTAANIAAKTPGSKNIIPVIEASSNSSPKLTPVRDFSAGPIIYTGNPTDVAISDSDQKEKVFFSIAGSRYLTRDGEFLWKGSTLVDKHNNPVDGESGPIERNVSLGPVIFGKDGSIHQGRERINAFKLFTVDDPGAMDKVSGGFSPNAKSGDLRAAEKFTIVAKARENPNTSSIDGMTKLIETNRAHEAITRVLAATDSIMTEAAKYGGNI